jgi:creatinine amidohydrolase
MRLEDLTWMDVESYLSQDNRLMLVLGACEQHGHLSLTTDVRIPQAIGDAASLRTGVPIAPPLSFGISTSFAAYPGTISLRAATYLGVIEDIVRGLHLQGFHRILVLNGHGGNAPARSVLKELVNELPELRLAWNVWWESPVVVAVAEKHGLASSHASWIEAFPFTRLGDLPEGIKDIEYSPEILDAQETRAYYGDGEMGGPYQAPPEVMDEVFEAAVAAAVAELDRLKLRA